MGIFKGIHLPKFEQDTNPTPPPDFIALPGGTLEDIWVFNLHGRVGIYCEVSSAVLICSWSGHLPNSLLIIDKRISQL